MNNLLIICTSAKTSTDTSQRSAVRKLCQVIYGALEHVISEVELADIHDIPLPMFDGQIPQKHDHDSVTQWLTKINQSKAIFIGIPAYWGGVSGVTKNWFDVLCGPSYDLDEVMTVFSGKKVGFFIVGADEASSCGATEQFLQSLQMSGAMLVSQPLRISNPRSIQMDWTLFGNKLIEQAAITAREGLINE